MNLTNVKYIHVYMALLATCFHAGFFLGLFFGPKDGDDISS
jgi:hypothetical protein